MRKIVQYALVALYFTGLHLHQSIGQDTLNFHSYQGAIDTVFGGIDTNLYPSGILINKAPYDENFLLSNGVNVDNPVLEWNDFLFYHEAIKNASHGKYCDQSFIDLVTESQENHLNNEYSVELGVLNFNYHFIDDKHFSNGNLVWDSPKIKVNGNPSLIFEERRVFSFAPFIANTITKEVKFIIRNENFWSNDSIGIDSILVDFGDGMGYRKIEMNVYQEISYSDSGEVILKLNMYFSDATVLSSKSKLTIMDMLNNNRWFCFNDEQILQTPYEPPANDPTTFSLAFQDDNGNPVEGTYGIWYGCGNNNIRKPILVMHGFNPMNSKQLLPCFKIWPNDVFVGVGGAWRGTLYETYNGSYNSDFSINNISGYPNGAEFLDRLREEGYDIIIPQLNYGTDHVAKNAAFIRGMIYYLNGIVETNHSKHELVVIGNSLGAVSARYAIAKAERLFEQYKNTPNSTYYPHPRCRLFVSVEGEYQGSSTSISFQNHVYFWGNAIPLNPKDIAGVIITNMAQGVVDNEAAKELCTFHSLASNNNFIYPHHTRNDLLADLHYNVGLPTTVDKLNGYPLYCRRVAISDGSSTGIKNTGFPNIRTKLFELKTASNMLYSTNFHRESEGYTCDPSGYLNNNFTYHKESYMLLLYSIRINFIPQSSAYFYYQNLLDYDRMPGSMLANYKYYFLPPSPLDDISSGLSLCDEIYNVGISPTTWGNHCESNLNLNSFVPTVSALDLYDKDQVQMSTYNSGLVADVSAMHLFKLNANTEHPFQSYGFPFLHSPNDPYQYTPFDAIYALGTNHSPPNRLHVEDPAIDQAVYLANVEIAPIDLFLSNRNINDYGDNLRIYKAAFEARHNVTAGYDVYAENVFSINNTSIEHHLTPDGNFVIEPRTDVDVRAGNQIHLKPGFEAHNGCQFHAFIQAYPTQCPDNLKSTVPVSNGNNAQQNSKPENNPTVVKVNERLNVYPNPNSGQFMVELLSETDLNTSVEIYDLSGKLVQKMVIQLIQGNNVIPMNTSTVQSGIYYLRIQGYNEVKKIIVNK